MGAGLLILIGLGEQDQFITGNPQISFFKYVYKRHTNFSNEIKRQIFSGGVSFGNLNSCIINKDGDLISDVSLYINLDSLNGKNKNNICVKDINLKCNCNNCNKKTIFSWVNSIGHAIFDYIEIEIGGILIDKQYSDWYEIWSELSLSFDKKNGFNELIGKKNNYGFNINSFNDKLELFVPLKFWFCKNIGLALPIIALNNHDIRINIKWKQFNQLWISNNKDSKPCVPNFEAMLYVNYIYLDINERKKFSNKNHFYLIEQTQNNGDYHFHKHNKNPTIKLNFYHPVKQIIWAIQREDVLINDNENNEECDNFSYGNDWFNFSNHKSFNNSEIVDIFDTAIIQLNGQDLSFPLPAKYLRLYIPYKYYTGIPNNFIYTYNFSLKPEDIQPSGTCNFSCFDNARLILNIKDKEIKSNYLIKIFAVNYNVLLITNGMAGLAFSC